MGLLAGTGGQATSPGETELLWVACLPSSHVASIGALRLAPGIETHASGESVWLRGCELDKDLDRRLRALPGARRFRVLADGQLLAVGRRVPQGRIPDGPWVPLVRWLGIELPPASGAARLGRPIPLELQPSSDVAEPSVLLTSMDCWGACADECPQVRLDRWRFAVSGNGRVAIAGRPLPSLPGLRLVDYNGIAVPAGWYWSPPVEPAVLRERFGLEGDDLMLWHAEGALEHVPGGHFVRATRLAIRATVEGFQLGRP